METVRSEEHSQPKRKKKGKPTLGDKAVEAKGAEVRQPHITKNAVNMAVNKKTPQKKVETRPP